MLVFINDVVTTKKVDDKKNQLGGSIMKKKLLSVLLSAAMAASGLGISAQAKTLSEQVKTPKSVLVGDCNQDGTVDLSDLVSMQLYLL